MNEFRQLAEAMPHFVWTARADGTIDYFNRRWLDYTGLAPEDTRSYTDPWSPRVVHPDDLERAWRTWAEAVRSGEPYEIEYRLRNKDTGAYRWFLVRGTPVRDGDGTVLRWVGTCTDFDEEYRAAQRLRFVAKAGERIFESLDVERTFAVLLDLIVNEVADWAAVDLIDGGGLRTVAITHKDPAKRQLLENLRGLRTMKPAAEEVAIRALHSRRSHMFTSAQSPDLSRAREGFAKILRHVGLRSGITVPLYVRERTLGALVAYRFEEPQDFTPNDLLLFEELGRHASIAIENARIFAREHEVAATLQRTLLPARLPVLDGWDLSASYAPGAPDASVGGDWYDAFVLPSGECVFTVGDVTGRGLAAATIMGTIRQALANIALYESDPARLLDAADRVLNERHPEALVTAFVAIVDTAHRTLRYANAGHPFPYVRTGDGGVEELEARGLPLGIRGLGPPAESRERTLEDAALVVFFTDGLVEATRDLSQGVARLRSVLQTEAAIAVAEPAATIARACRVGVEEARDDVAILALRPRAFARWTFEAPNAVSAEHARAEFVAYLRTQDENGSSLDLESAEAIFGELVSNVVRHAPGPIEITLELRAPHPVLHVLDSGPPFADPAVLPIDLYAEGGRGLYVIAKLAASVRLETLLGIGNHIAVELPLRSGQGSAPRVPSAPAELEMR